MRSQNLEKGGAILKEWEKCTRPWPEFSLFLNQFHTVRPKIVAKFLGKLGNSKVFSAQNQVISKKKKKEGLHQNWDWFFGRNSKFKGFFCPKSGGLQKKKKKEGLHQNWDWFFSRNPKFKGFFCPNSGGLPKKKVFTEVETNFSAKFRNSNVWGGAVFLWGGYFQFFTKNRPQKHQKRAILHTSQANGGARALPPAPPLATLLITHILSSEFTRKTGSVRFLHKQLKIIFSAKRSTFCT